MELDKRVEEVETELKIVKGEIKELLVDIRDLVNKNENPFYNGHRHGVSRLEAKEESESENQFPADEEKEDLKSSAGLPEAGLKDKKDKESFQEPSSAVPLYEVPEGNMLRQNTPVQPVDTENQVRKMDTFTLVELMRWVDYAVRTIGHSNLKVLLDLYSLTGQLPEEAKYIIENIANLPIEEPAGEEKVNMKDNITVLAQLNAILNPGGFRNKVQPLY